MPRTCAFCPQGAVERGGEHIWDDWVNKALPKTLYRARKRYSLDSPTIEYNTRKLGEQLPVVCADCNSGWMSALTNKTKEAFSLTVLEGKPFTLGSKDAALLAAFTFMKAVVTNHNIDYEPFFSRGARERFRTSLSLPPWVKVWFGAYQGSSRMSTKNNQSIISTDTPGPLNGIEFCSFTYVLGRLVLQLLAPRWKHLSNRGQELLSLSPHVYWNQVAILFWPHDGSLLSWPPPKLLGDDMIQEFIERFNMPVNLPNR